MTKKEFVKIVEDDYLYDVKEDKHEKTNNDILKIIDDESLVAIIDEEIPYHFNTMFKGGLSIGLLNIIAMYSTTPIKDRK